MTGPHIEDHLTEWQEVEQERDHYQAECETLKNVITDLCKELDEVKTELRNIKNIYFRNN